MRSVITLVSGILLTAAATCTHAQGQPPAATPAPAASHPAAKPAVKPAAKSASKKRARTVSVKSAPEGSEAQAPKTGRRDPFESLVGRQKAQADAAKNLPPGKGGLQVGTLRVDGIVHA